MVRKTGHPQTRMAVAALLREYLIKAQDYLAEKEYKGRRGNSSSGT